MWHISLQSPWLLVRFNQPSICLGWTPQGGGRTESDTILWRQVRDDDLSEGFDVLPWLARQTQALGYDAAPCFLTSAQIADFAEAEAEVEGFIAKAVVTAGLGNAERIGHRYGPSKPFGTINAAVIVNRALSEQAALEALSLMTEARTTAMLEVAPHLWPHRVTGTGTDCMAICFPKIDAAPEAYCGKHTALGEAIGAAALKAFGAAIALWKPPL